jgi:hypothetical protein
MHVLIELFIGCLMVSSIIFLGIALVCWFRELSRGLNR